MEVVGSPIYLVCACASAEEFVAAFRRYADKGGLFVPIAEPLPAGRRGTFALVTATGLVMVAGEAEIVASSRGVSPLYGRVGMTIKFVEPDGPSREVLAELDRARLVTKVSPPAVAVPTIALPDGPRPTVPTASGRIDAANALAETVAIGDVAGLRDAAPPKLGPKFVIPTIPTTPSGRTKSPSAFPIAQARTPMAADESSPRHRPASVPPPLGSAPIPAPRAKPATAPPSVKDTQPVAVVPPPARLDGERSGRALGASLPPLEDLKVGTTQAVAVVPPPQWAAKNLFDGDGGDGDTDRSKPAPTPTHVRATALDPIDPIDPADDPIAPPPVVVIEPVGEPPVPTLRGLGADKLAAMLAEVHTDEATDLSVAPALDLRTTVPGLGVPPPRDTELMTVPPTPPARAPVIEEPTPSGNWTMTPDGSISVLPSTPRPAARATSPLADDGDWTMTPDQDAPAAAWTAIPATAKTPPKGMPNTDTSGVVKKETRVIEAVRAPDREIRHSEPKIQIDPELAALAPPTPPPSTLVAIAHAQPLAAAPMIAPPPAPPRLVAPPVFAPPPQLPAVPMAYVPASTGTLPQVDESSVRPRARGGHGKTIAVAALALVVVAGVIAVIVAATRKPSAQAAAADPPPAPTKTVPRDGSAAPALVERTTNDPPSGSAVAPEVGSGSGSDAAVAIGSAGSDGSAAGAVPDDPPPPSIAGDCAIDVTSTPNGAEIYDARGFRLGTAPQRVPVPCERTKLVLKKATYADTARVVMPTKAGVKLKVALGHAPLVVKVSSVPSGAAVAVNGRPMGVTPTTIPLPMLETSTLVFTKEGFASESAKVTPRQPNQAVQVQLKRRRR